MAKKAAPKFKDKRPATKGQKMDVKAAMRGANKQLSKLSGVSQG